MNKLCPNCGFMQDARNQPKRCAKCVREMCMECVGNGHTEKSDAALAAAAAAAEMASYQSDPRFLVRSANGMLYYPEAVLFNGPVCDPCQHEFKEYRSQGCSASSSSGARLQREEVRELVRLSGTYPDLEDCEGPHAAACYLGIRCVCDLWFA